jgi:carotenoid cleavage dioxygenase-like enzyme
MGYHFANAYEQGDEILLDVAAYSNASVYSDLNIGSTSASATTNTDTNTAKSSQNEVGRLQRCCLPLRGSYVDYELLSEESIEFPTVSYRQYNAKPYQYVYGVSRARDGGAASGTPSQLLKANVVERTAQIWSAPRCYPGEPIFVAKPNATQEDEGVVLSVVLDEANAKSFLLVLDGQSFTELGRAQVPHHIPFGLHGLYQG